MRISLLTLICALSACSTNRDAVDPGRGGAANTSSGNVATVEPISRTGSGGGLWEQLAGARRRKEARLEARTRKESRLRTEFARGRASIPIEWQKNMSLWWGHFLNQDPSWSTESKHKWVKLGSDASDILVQNLIMVMVNSFDIRNGVMYRHARNELFWLREKSIPYLVSALSQNFGDDVIRNQCISLLEPMGEDVIDPIVESFEGSDARGKFNLLRAAAELKSLKLTPFFQRVIRDSDDFKLRIAAISGIGKSADPRGAGTLIGCLSDEDISVRKFSSMYMGYLEDQKAVVPLIECMRRAEVRVPLVEREAEVVANCRKSLRMLTGESFRTSDRWESWRRRNGR